MAPTCACKAAAAWALLGAAFLGWVIYIAGVGSLHYACHHDLDWDLRSQLMFASGMVPHQSCAYTFGWYWFLTFFQLAAVLLAAVAAAGVAGGCLKSGALALLAIITTLLLESTKVFLQLHYNLPGGYLAFTTDPTPTQLTSRADKCALAGGILCCVFNALAGTALGWRRDCTHAAGAADGCYDKAPPAAGATAYVEKVAAKTAEANAV